MEKYLYFANGNDADASGEAAIYPASAVTGIIPEATTSTVIYFRKNDDAMDNQETRDIITLTHDDTTNTTGHRIKDISKVIASAINAGPHVGGLVDVVDLDNSIYLGNLSFVTAVDIEMDGINN